MSRIEPNHPVVGDVLVMEPRVRSLVVTVFGPLRAPTLTGWRRTTLLIGLVIAGALVSLARTPLHLWNILWAEDGSIFISGAISRGPWSLFDAYAGYMHLVPRLAADAAVLLPLHVVPLAVTMLAAIITSLVACACFVFIESRLESVWLRFASWIACLALPIMGDEVANNLANLHWYLLIGAFCAAATRARSIAVVIAQSAVLFCAVTSDALTLILLPIFIFRWWVYAKRRDRLPSIVFLIGAVIQCIVVAAALLSGHGRPASTTHPRVSQVLDLYAYRVVLDALFGVSAPARIFDFIGTMLPGLAVASVLAVLVAAAIADPGRRIGIAFFAVSSLVFGVIVFVLQRDAFARSPLLDMFNGGRYAVVPVALLVLALLLAADAGIARVTRLRVRAVLAVAVLLAVLIPVIGDFRPTDIRSHTPTWSDAIHGAAAICSSDSTKKTGNITIAPTWFGGMNVPCDILTPFAR